MLVLHYHQYNLYILFANIIINIILCSACSFANVVVNALLAHIVMSDNILLLEL